MTDRRASLGKLVFLGALVAVGIFSAAPLWMSPARADRKARKKLSKRAMKKLMNRWAREIGEKCVYCHVKEGEQFDYEASTPKKTIAAYCDEHFMGKLLNSRKKPVTCNDCHNKKATFLPRPKKSKQPPKKGK
jgi:cytochrome c553